MDVFKEEFKYFKRKRPPPDLHKIIDFDRATEFPDYVESVSRNSTFCSTLGKGDCEAAELMETFDSLGLTSPLEWKMHKVPLIEGLLVISNPFKPAGQRMWIEKCLKDYPRKPNITNIDNLASKTESCETSNNSKYDGIWEAFMSKDPNKRTLLPKLRWTTLGYHHNWDTKVYSKQSYAPFPSCLERLCVTVASALGYPNFEPQSAIINYYHMDSCLSGHTDHSEPCLSAPLFSFSFGQTAVFLIGGKTKSVRPISMFLKSGDIVIMSGESRLAYHGVPCIIKAEAEPWMLDVEDQASWSPFAKYIANARINMNVRQVLSPGEELPS